MSNNNSFGGKLKKVLASMCSFVVGASGVSQAANSMVHSFINANEGFNEAQYIKDLQDADLGENNIFGQGVVLHQVEDKGLIYLGMVRDNNNGSMKLIANFLKDANDQNGVLIDLCVIPFEYFAKMWWNYTNKHKEGDNTDRPVTLYDWGRLLGLTEEELKNLCYIGPEKEEAKGLYEYNDAGFGYVKWEYMSFIVASASGDYGFLRQAYDGELKRLGNVIEEIANKVGVQHVKNFNVGEVGEDMEGLYAAIVKCHADTIGGDDEKIGNDLKETLKGANVDYKDEAKFSENLMALINKYNTNKDLSNKLSTDNAGLKTSIEKLQGKSPWGKTVGTGLVALLLGGGATAGAHMGGIINLPGCKKTSNGRTRGPKARGPVKPGYVKVPKRGFSGRAK